MDIEGATILEAIADRARAELGLDISIDRVSSGVVVTMDGETKAFANWLLATTALDYYVRGRRAEVQHQRAEALELADRLRSLMPRRAEL